MSVETGGGDAAPAEIEKLPPEANVALPPGVKPSKNYVAAIELGHVLAASGLYRDAKDPAKAAVKVMIGMDIGVSPTAAIQGIHTFEEDGKSVFLIEGKLLAGVVKGHPNLEYKIVERTDEKVELEFLRRDSTDGELKAEGPNIVWTVERAKREVSGFAKKTKTWGAMPMVMLTWRALAEGVRIYFPDVIAGQPIYLDEEFDFDRKSGVQEALHPTAEPLTTERAEELRGQLRETFDEIRELNATRMPPARFDKAVKSAEHSHERLESVLASLVDLRDSEKRVIKLTGKVTGALDRTEAKAVLASADRKGTNAERIEVLQGALEDASIDAEATEEEASGDGE